MSKWIDIAERCEKATGPDEALDAEIWASATGLPVKFWKNPVEGDPYWETIEFFYENGSPCYMPVPSLSASLDAITALIDRELPGSMRSIRKHPDGEAVAQVWNSQVVGETPRQRCCASEALALCAAFCRAMNQADGKAVERKNAIENGCGNG